MKTLQAIFFLLIAMILFAAKSQAQVLVIANPNVNTNSVSKADLSKVYTGATSQIGGSHVVPALLKQGTIHTDFLTNYVGQAPVSVLVIWRGLVLSGQATMPRTFDSEEDLVKYVAHTPGAIGYIDKSTPHEGVKSLTVSLSRH
jgi:ABC-type phosphate transport system substrate-binding protein